MTLARDKSELVALIACVIPFLGSLPHTILFHLDAVYLSPLSALFGLIFLPFGLILVGYPQLVMYLAVRSLRSRAARWIGALSSLGLAIWYATWAVSADTSGSSTAGVALVLFPIMVQWWVWLLAFVAVLAVSWLKTRTSP